MSRRLVLATRNPGKVAELAHRLDGLGYALVYAADVVGAGAASIDAVGAAMAVGGLGVLDSEANSTQLPPLVFSVGGPLANRFTAVFNPVGRVGYGGNG